MRKSFAAGVAALVSLCGPAVAQAGVSQTAHSGCLATPSASLKLSGAVGAGDDLLLVVSGNGYTGAAATVTGVSDNVNGAWSPLVNDKSLPAGDGVSNLSYSVWHLVNSKAAPSGLTVKVSENAGQNQAAGVVLDVAGPVTEDQVQFQTAVAPQSKALTTPAVNASANELAVGLFGPWNDLQKLSVGSGWSLAAKVENCSAALVESQVVPASGSLKAVAASGMSEYALSGLMTFQSATAPTTNLSAPTNTTLPAVSGAAQSGSRLTTTTGSWTGSPTSYTYGWEDCSSAATVCSPISGASSSSYTVQSSDVGHSIRSLVTATNAAGSAPAQSAATASVPTPLAPSSTTLPAISGTPQQGNTLSVSNGTWANSPTGYAYQWQDCTTSGCSNISGATGSSYVLQASDVGDAIDTVVTASNSAGSMSATSGQTVATTAASTTQPPSTGGPTVTVTNTNGSTLDTQLSTNDVWSGMLGQVPNGPTEFKALQAPLVRLHIGDDGWPAALPEIQQGQWSFSAIDALVNDVFATGQKPLMNIKFAPDWMWSCYPNSIGVTNKQSAGSVVDQTFQTYAQYMARLVSYYNKGSMTTESGTVITNPAGTSHAITYWEPWNEPDLSNETPCAPSTGVGLTVSQYLTMWNAVTAAMLKVDPTIKFVGPATAGAQFGSSNTTGNQYVDSIMTNAVTKPAAISFHGYGYWDNTVTDQWIFDGDGSGGGCACGGITDMVNGVKAIRGQYPNLPVWLDEVNVNADWGNDTYARPWSAFAAAWWGAAFAQLAPLGAGMIDQYDAADGPQFGMIDSTTGAPYMSYYVTQLLDRAFPPGSTLLSSSSTDSGILSLAVRKPDGTMSVMVVDRKLVSSTAKSACGTGGVAEQVNVSLPSAPTAVTLQQLDSSNVNCVTGAAVAPAVRTVTPAQNLTVNLPGYGIAVLNVTG